MNKIVRNALIAAAVAVAVGFVFGFLGAVLHAPGVGSSGQLLAELIGRQTPSIDMQGLAPRAA